MQTAMTRQTAAGIKEGTADKGFFGVPLKERINAETLAAMAEVRRMEMDESLGKAYYDVDEMMADILR